MNIVPDCLRRGPWRHLSDLDVLHSLAIAVLACVASGGLLFVWYFVRSLAIARHAPTTMQRARTLLVFGKRLVGGHADADYLARISRAHEQIAARRCERVFLLGGADTGPTEAAVADAELRRLGLPAGIEVILEQSSVDTLENLRNARDLLAAYGRTPVALLSSRYHLARCALLARQLRFDFELVAAEDRFVPSCARLRRLALEAGYILWADIGTRWARLIGNRRMLERVT
ncbi:MAG: YdcF family protein [Rudaea sp.]|uniref:YdcF family protein n=1 Tax=unclassified Rudaea TaxID=2627037 RepID=UPI002015F5EE|nr:MULTISPECIES: YdcF family protein [unclassified Rudaea]MBR0344527.1 YdcF family protein [Rudaea sp.]